MPLCERTARTGLQIAFETDGAFLARELDYDVSRPRSVHSGMWTFTGVVATDSGCNVAGQSDVETRNLVLVFQNVDESFVAHVRHKRKASTPFELFEWLKELEG